MFYSLDLSAPPAGKSVQWANTENPTCEVISRLDTRDISVRCLEICCGYRLELNLRRQSKAVKEGTVLFNDVLNTIYLQLYGVGYIVKDY